MGVLETPNQQPPTPSELRENYYRSAQSDRLFILNKIKLPDFIVKGVGDRNKTAPLTNRENLKQRRDKKDPRGGSWVGEDNFRATIMSASVPKSFKTKMDNETDILNSYWGWIGIVEPEYDLLEPYTIYDTESIYFRSIQRQHSLMFRNGVTVTGENEQFVEYINRRLQQIGYVSHLSFTELIKQILWNLMVCSNCFLLKVRDTNASGGKANEKNNNKVPVAGYKLIPPNTIFPFLNGRGQIEFWRRFFGNGRPYRDYKNEDIIHFVWHRKPGHLFGTPRIAAVRDDIFALRRLEENYELLLAKHQFPLQHVKVGTEHMPCEYYPDGTSEADMIRSLLQDMPKEGVLVTDSRVEIDTHGAQGEAMDPKALIDHYLNRVLIGLGVSGIDLGLADTANRSTADNISQNLKDAIKADLDQFSDMVSNHIFKELFQEANWQLSVQNAWADTRLQFHEIDVDTQIKKDNHSLNLYNNHAITHPELRSRIKAKNLKPEDEKQLHFERHEMTQARFQHNSAVALEKLKHEHSMAQAAANPPSTKGGVKKKKVSSSSPRKTTKPNKAKSKTAAARTVETKSQPRNQHGVNTDPHKARSSEELELIYDLLREKLADPASHENWPAAVSDVLDTVEMDAESREYVEKFLQLSQDEDMLFALLTASWNFVASDQTDSILANPDDEDQWHEDSEDAGTEAEPASADR